MHKAAVLLIAVLSLAALGAYQYTVPNQEPAFYVFDGFGGLHSGNGAPNVYGLPYQGSDVYVDSEVVSYSVCPTSGKITNVGVWSLDQYGGVHASQGAPPPATVTPYFGFPIAKDLEFLGPPTIYSACP